MNHKTQQTSVDALEFVKPHLPDIRRRVLQAIENMNGATCDEVEQSTGLSHQTASSAVHWLHHDKRMIADSGQRRPTRAGRRAIVWMLPVRSVEIM